MIHGCYTKPSSSSSPAGTLRVIVWTEPADVTPDAEAGKDGVISAQRIVLPVTS